MAARFILSFDCEGKWGVAHGLTARHARDLSDEKLSNAYSSILRVLEEYEIGATFAFVGAFSQSPEGFGRIRGEIEALSRQAPAYFEPTLRDIDESHGAGWHGHRYVDAVMDSRVGHEIALHGVTHVPWTSVDDTFAEAELCLVKQFEGPVRDSRTFVYPRNLVAHAGLLAKHGFEGYRTARRTSSRAASLLSEFNFFEAPEHLHAAEDIVPIPAGHFLNWPSGLRKLVPPQVTRMRAKRLLQSAARAEAVVHYWLHPENIASAPSMLDLLRALTREVAGAREAGDCEVVTQVRYCQWAKAIQ